MLSTELNQISTEKVTYYSSKLFKNPVNVIQILANKRQFDMLFSRLCLKELEKMYGKSKKSEI